ncbi:MAG: hypothetical protein ACYC6L_03175 [Anaerolineae bacterium]
MKRLVALLSLVILIGLLGTLNGSARVQALKQGSLQTAASVTVLPTPEPALPQDESSTGAPNRGFWTVLEDSLFPGQLVLDPWGDVWRISVVSTARGSAFDTAIETGQLARHSN